MIYLTTIGIIELLRNKNFTFALSVSKGILRFDRLTANGSSLGMSVIEQQL